MSLSRRAFATTLATTSLLRPATSRQAESKSRAQGDLQEFQAQLFDAHQLETVAAITDVVIPTTETPGARAAVVHQHLDGILFASTRPVQTAFLDGLSWLDGYCLQTESKPFVQLTPQVQEKILIHLLAADEPELQPGHVFALSAKNWTARVYYSTEIGQKELNKDGRVPASYAGQCKT